ncbi:MAG: hypothetical protein ABIL09_08210 [Gemmatimonadota bacterium]
MPVPAMPSGAPQLLAVVRAQSSTASSPRRGALPQGRPIRTFDSVWRLEPDGRWRIVFDRGCPPCDCGIRLPHCLHYLDL